uniref:Uncharacterized protein n=1 Tax=Musa acuminata subsp. malaccensis TaxID=214687 RepID=A0A804HNC6_MUSAM
MAPADQENTAFITDRGIYCYKVMPFGLKNAGATYQRMVDKLFRRQIGRNMEIYCVFGVSSGRFLGFVIHQRGIDANPEKVRAITWMHSPCSVKEVQCLTGKLAALSRFISRSGDRCLPFFQTLQQVNNFTWTPECEEAFKDLKAYLTRLPRLASPPPKQQPIYYLRPYFQSHTIKLSEFDIQYSPQNAIKAQVLADFITELTPEDFGLILKSPTGETYERSIRLQFQATNNEADYEARDPTMASYLAETQRLARLFSRFSITQPITAPTIPSCGIPDDPTAARRLRRTQAWYSLVGGKLYRRGFSQPLLLCLAPPKAHTVLAELHEGICGEHIGGRTLAF